MYANTIHRLLQGKCAVWMQTLYKHRLLQGKIAGRALHHDKVAEESETRQWSYNIRRHQHAALGGVGPRQRSRQIWQAVPVAEGVDQGGDCTAAAGEEDRGGDGAKGGGVEQLERNCSGGGAGGVALCAPKGEGRARVLSGGKDFTCKQIQS